MIAVNSFPGQGQNNPLSESIASLSEAELIAYFANRSHVTYPDLPKASDEQLKNAADILSNRFSYTGETFQFEPEFSWKPNPSFDKEWQIAFHKHYFLIDLVQAYRHTGEVIYLDKWQYLIQSWITEMGSGYIILSDAQVEAKRMESWCIAFMLLKGTKWHEHIQGCFIRQLLTRIAEETHYISQNLKPVRNHRTFQLYAIYLVGVLFPELSLNKYFRETGTELLSQNLLTDFHKDGVHIEMSSHYHQLVAETGIRMLELAILNHLDLCSELVSRLHKAVRFSLYLQWPNGDIPLINDSDNGNHLDLLRLGNQYLNDSELLWGATLGVSGQAPKNASIFFPDSGYFILGDTWGIDEQTYAERQHVFFDCGKLGEGSHSHYDLFNFCYYVDRKPAVIDPGRYTYAGEPDANGVNWRHYFKSTASHNTVTIDHQDQTLFLSRTKHGPEVNLEERDWLLGKKTDWVFGRARSPHYSPIHERLIVYMGHQYLFILDRLLSDDAIQHHYELNFHLPAGTNTDLIVQPNGYHLLTNECEIRAIANENASARIKPGWVSQYYGIKHAAPIFSLEQSVEGNSVFASVVAPKPSGNFLLQDFQRDKLNDTTYCFSVNFKAGKHYFDDRFMVSVADDEIMLDKLNFYGRFIAYRQDNDGNVLFASSQAMKEITIDGIGQRYPEGKNFEWLR
jgi:hypothetical protein